MKNIPLSSKENQNATVPGTWTREIRRGSISTKIVPVGKFRRHIARGFTLIEVVLAPGIIAPAFVAMQGMLPIGLKTARNAMETSTGSQIVQRIATQVKQRDVKSLTQTNYTFDDQANEASSLAAPKIYDARITVNTGVAFPGCPANSTLAGVTIEAVNNPGRKANAFDGTLPRKVYCAYAARSSAL
ncbi:MAG: Verru_Chthon cassette protein B [Verrucomicrobiota bacterium]